MTSNALGLSGFDRLGRACYIFQPESTSGPKPTDAPDVIFIASWLDAQPKHIVKYTDGYKKLYPHARILVVMTDMSEVVWRTRSYVRESRRPALEILVGLPAATKLMLHAFSNGGGFTATQMAVDYESKMHRSLPVMAVVLDSLPGTSDWNRSIAAFEMGLPKDVVSSTIGPLLIRMFMFVYVWICFVMKREDRIMLMRRNLSDARLFDTLVPRLYIYSEEDKLILSEDVKDHVTSSRAAGYVCREERFIGSQHVNHMVLDSKRYWAAVRDLWMST